MAGTFKFPDFLTTEEREALNKLREKLGGKMVYIPYPEKNHYHQVLEMRNHRIHRMFKKYKMLGLSTREIYAEIFLRLSCAKGLSMNRIRAIVHGYYKKK